MDVNDLILMAGYGLRHAYYNRNLLNYSRRPCQVSERVRYLVLSPHVIVVIRGLYSVAVSSPISANKFLHPEICTARRHHSSRLPK